MTLRLGNLRVWRRWKGGRRDPPSDAENPPFNLGETRFGRIVWGGIAAICLLLFFGRLVAAWWYEGWGKVGASGLLVGCALLLYASFLIEGIILASAKVEEYDETEVSRRLREKYPTENIGATIVYVKRRAGDILVGQPLVAICITLLFGGIVDMLGLPLNSSGVPVNPAAQRLPSLAIWALSSSLVAGALSAALIYWLAQLLPQSMGKSNAIEFMRFPFARYAANLLVLLSRLGVGAPSGWIQSLAPSRFKELIDLPISNRKLFESLTDDFGYSVDTRSITIRPAADHVAVIDETTYVYRNPRKKIRHSYRIVLGQFNGSIQFEIIFPNVTQTTPRGSLFEFDLLQVTDGATAAGEVQSIYKEAIQVIESVVESGLKEITTRASYRRNRLATNPEGRDEFAFDMGVPTREVRIRVEKLAGVFVPDEPKVIFISEDTRFLQRPGGVLDIDGWYQTVPQLERGNKAGKLNDDGWSIVHTFPPMSAEMLILLDAQAAV